MTATSSSILGDATTTFLTTQPIYVSDLVTVGLAATALSILLDPGFWDSMGDLLSGHWLDGRGPATV